MYRLCMAGTVEEKMLERAANKRKLEHMVVSNGKFVTAGATAKASAVKAMNADDLMELLKDNYADGKVRRTPPCPRLLNLPVAPLPLAACSSLMINSIVTHSDFL